MSFLTFNANLSLVTVELRRIADALDRAIPPISTVEPPLPRPSTLADLHVTGNYVTGVQTALSQFAEREGIASVNSDLFISRIIEYEAFLQKEFGDEFIDSLPWNKDGRIFTAKQEPSEEEAAARVAEREKGPANSGQSE